MIVDFGRRHEILAAVNDAVPDRHQIVTGKIGIDPVENIDEQGLIVVVSGTPMRVVKRVAGCTLDCQPRFGVVFGSSTIFATPLSSLKKRQPASSSSRLILTRAVASFAFTRSPTALLGTV